MARQGLLPMTRATEQPHVNTHNVRMIGDAAKNQMVMNPENTMFDAKRMIGRRLDDPFCVVNDCGKLKIRAGYKGG